MLRHTDLCSGIGGFALGFEWAGLSKPVMFCDIEPWSRKVLAKHWPDVPIAEDVRKLANDPARLVPDCHILSCGYPCQPFSQAGIRRGEKDDRHIWPEIFTIIQAKRPDWIVCENVYGHISLGIDQVLSDLEAEGYACQPFVVPACAVNAPHRRDRVWIVAHANSQGEPNGTKHEQRMVGNTQNDRRDRWAKETRRSRSESESDKFQSSIRSQSSGSGQDVADTHSSGEGRGLRSLAGADAEKDRPKIEHQDQAIRFGDSGQDVADTYSARCQEQWWGEPAQSQYEAAKCGDWWSVEPPVGRLANGIPDRVAQLKGLGNAIVPQIAMQIGLTIKAVENGTNN